MYNHDGNSSAGVWFAGPGLLGSISRATLPCMLAKLAMLVQHCRMRHSRAASGLTVGCTRAAHPVGAAAMPPVATLLGGGGGGGGGEAAGASLARRLARRTGRSVAVAWALPEEPPGLALAAEQRLVQELAALGLAGGPCARGLTLAS